MGGGGGGGGDDEAGRGSRRKGGSGKKKGGGKEKGGAEEGEGAGEGGFGPELATEENVKSMIEVANELTQGLDMLADHQVGRQ